MSRFSPKDGPSLRIVQQAWTVKSPGKKSNDTLSLIRNQEKRTYAFWQVSRDHSFFLPLFFSLLTFHEASPSLKMVLLWPHVVLEAKEWATEILRQDTFLWQEWELELLCVLQCRGEFLSLLLFFSPLFFLITVFWEQPPLLKLCNFTGNQNPESKLRFWTYYKTGARASWEPMDTGGIPERREMEKKISKFCYFNQHKSQANSLAANAQNRPKNS